MSLAELLSLLLSVLQFPKETAAFLKLIQVTPEQQRDSIMDKISAEQRDFEETGRPKW